MASTGLLAIGAAVLLHSPVAAQVDVPPEARNGVRWSYFDAVGYGGLGFGLGLLAAWDIEGTDIGPPGTAIALVGATTVAGVVAGAVTGRRAETVISRGRRLGGAHRSAVIGGVILAGGALGALAAVPFINSDGEGTPFGSDEQTVTLMALTGAALGSLFAWTRRSELGARSVRLEPAFFDDDRYGLAVRVSP